MTRQSFSATISGMIPFEKMAEAAAAHYGAGRLQEAAALFASLTRQVSDRIDYAANAAILLRCLERYAEAARFYRHVLILQPNFAPAVGGLADCPSDGPDAARQAHAWSRRGVRLDASDPACLEAWARHAERRGDYAAAAAAWRRRLAVSPNDAITLFNYALILEFGGDVRTALAVYDRSRRSDPTFKPGWEKARLNLAACRWASHDADAANLLAQAHGEDGAPQLDLTYIGSSPADQLASARGRLRQAGIDKITPLAPVPLDPNKERLTIGYVSGDFRQHPTSYLAAELFELHDRRRYRVLGYSSFSQTAPDPMRRRLDAAFDGLIDISGLEAAAAADLLRRDGVDIAVDLSGHTLHNRLDVFAYRPAPLQLTWLGYPGTTGGDFFDGIIVDPVVAPAEDQPFFSEPLLHLPRCYQVNDRSRTAAAPQPTRADCGLPETGFVFACFNHAPKISPAVFRQWMRLLSQTPGAVLWLRGASPLIKDKTLLSDNLRAEAAKSGVAPERLIFAPNWLMTQHLNRYRLADLVIDTFPYGSHTTASDALWMGCPLATRRGDTFASRVAASLLTHLGMSELIAHSADEYEALVLSLTTDPARLADLRRRLQAAAAAAIGPFDTPGFARDLEAVYEKLWREKTALKKQGAERP